MTSMMPSGRSENLVPNSADVRFSAARMTFDASPSGSLAKQSALEQFLTGDALQPWTRREQLDKLTRTELNRRLKRDLKGVELSSVIAYSNGDPAAKKAAKKAGKKR